MEAAPSQSLGQSQNQMVAPSQSQSQSQSLGQIQSQFMPISIRPCYMYVMF